MKRIIKHVAMGMSCFVFLSCADNEPRTITVSEEVIVEIVADLAILDVQYRATSKSKMDVLKQLSLNLPNIQNDLLALEGIKHISIETSEATIAAIPSKTCLAKYSNLIEDLYDLDELERICQNTEYYSSVNLTVSVIPAEMAGNVLSYAFEQGAVEVSLNEFVISDKEAAMQMVKSEAARKTRISAEEIAKASGVRILELHKLSFRGNSHFNDNYDGDEVIVTGSRIKQSSYTLELKPTVKKIKTRVTATFSVTEK